jgi:hypothetical protein
MTAPLNPADIREAVRLSKLLTECWEGEPPSVALFKPAWRATPSKKNDGWLVVIGPFDEGFIRDVHSATENRWDHGLKARLVHSRHASELDAIIEHHSLPVDVEVTQ